MWAAEVVRASVENALSPTSVSDHNNNNNMNNTNYYYYSKNKNNNNETKDFLFDS